MVDRSGRRRHAWTGPRHVNKPPRRDFRARLMAAAAVLVMLAPAALVDAAPPPGTPRPAQPEPYRITSEFDFPPRVTRPAEPAPQPTPDLAQPSERPRWREHARADHDGMITLSREPVRSTSSPEDRRTKRPCRR